jgi:D-erythronate 2-dehydrogenase
VHVLVTGANGFVGRALAARLASQGRLDGRPIERLSLIDVHFEGAQPPQAFERRWAADLADPACLDAAFAGPPLDVVVHLASIPGGTAEEHYAVARKVNLDATLALLERCKAQSEASGRVPRFVFASSIAVFGAISAPVSEDSPPRPQMTYGAHKLIGEILVQDFSRRAWIHGISLRLPGILARPPARTGQLSAFLSDILHEVAAGHRFTCPMRSGATTWASSLPNTVDNLLHAATLPLEGLTTRRTFTMPTWHFSMSQLVAAIGRVHRVRAEALVSFEPDERIESLFGRLPPLDTRAAEAAGFVRDADLSTLVRRALAVP